MFRTTIVKFNGSIEEKTHVLPEQAFHAACTDTGSVMGMVKENRWCCTSMTVKTISYLVRDKSVYVQNDNFYPIYSIKPEFKNIMLHRETLYRIVNRGIRAYQFYDKVAPYSTEFLYSCTVAELEALRNVIKNDPICRGFFDKIDHHITTMHSAAQCVDVVLPDLLTHIDKFPVKEIFIYIEYLNRMVTTMVISKAYGGIDYPDMMMNSLLC